MSFEHIKHNLICTCFYLILDNADGQLGSAMVSGMFSLFVLSFGIWIRTSADEPICAWLGDKVGIPCLLYKKQPQNIRWSYKKKDRSHVLVSMDKSGQKRFDQNLWTERNKVVDNFSLVIEHLREEDQGTYSCEICEGQYCFNSSSRSLLPLHESYSSITGTSVGGEITLPCPEKKVSGTFPVKWTFQAFGKDVFILKSDVRSGSGTEKGTMRHKLLPDGSIHLHNISCRDAGNYSCWRKICGWHRLQTLSFSFKTEVDDGARDGPHSVLCDGDGKQPLLPNNQSTQGTFMVSDVLVPIRTLDCRMGVDNTTYPLDIGSCKTETQEDRETNHLTLIMLGVLIACVCTMAILCFLFLCRYRRISENTTTDVSFGELLCFRSTRNTQQQLDSETVIYSTLDMGSHEGFVIGLKESCVYSSIKFHAISQSVD